MISSFLINYFLPLIIVGALLVVFGLLVSAPKVFFIEYGSHHLCDFGLIWIGLGTTILYLAVGLLIYNRLI